MPETFSGFLAAGVAIVGLGLALRVNRNSGRATHGVVILYGAGVAGVAPASLILIELARQ